MENSFSASADAYILSIITADHIDNWSRQRRAAIGDWSCHAGNLEMVCSKVCGSDELSCVAMSRFTWAPRTAPTRSVFRQLVSRHYRRTINSVFVVVKRAQSLSSCMHVGAVRRLEPCFERRIFLRTHRWSATCTSAATMASTSSTWRRLMRSSRWLPVSLWPLRTPRT